MQQPRRELRALRRALAAEGHRIVRAVHGGTGHYKITLSRDGVEYMVVVGHSPSDRRWLENALRDAKTSHRIALDRLKQRCSNKETPNRR
jgi:hypothetical protein